MTFANHHERQLCSACEGLAGPKRALYLRARDACKSCYKKAGSKQNRVRKRVLYRLTERFGGQKAAHPNPTERASVLEWEMISLVATRKLVINLLR
jgi:hypothetical protein